MKKLGVQKLGVWGLLAGVAAILPLLAGCETLTDTPGENANRMAHAVDLDLKQVPDDTEKLLLLDRPIQLTEKPVPMR